MEFWDLYHLHGGRVYNFLLRYLSNRDDAADLTGNIFLQAREKFSSLKNPDRAEAWLWAIARNLLKNYLRDRKPTTTLDETIEPVTTVPLNQNGHRVVKLKTALRRLDDAEREILLLREYQGMSYTELSTLLGGTVPAIKSRLFRARQHLKEAYFR